jgi:hypothetical protein
MPSARSAARPPAARSTTHQASSTIAPAARAARAASSAEPPLVHVLDHERARAGLEVALDPVAGTVLLRRLADEERVSVAARGGLEQRGQDDRVGPERESADRADPPWARSAA